MGSFDVKQFYNDRVEHFMQWEKEPERNYRLKMVFDLCDRYIKEKTQVLEIGCGIGLVSRHLRQRGIVPVSIDISEKCIEKACELNGVSLETSVFIVDDVSREDWYPPQFQYDAIIFSDVLEHLPVEAVARVFVRACERLREGGVIIISLPNYLSAKKTPEELLQVIDNPITLSTVISMCEHCGIHKFDFIATHGDYNVIVARRDTNA